MSTFLWQMRDGTLHECTRLDDVRCPMCGEVGTVVALPPPLLAIQPDDTTHVCASFFGGCNHGFAEDIKPAMVH